MQAIVTKYLPATNTKGSRIKAQCARGSLTVDYPHELSGEAVHIYAAKQLVAKFVAEDTKHYGSNPAKLHWASPFVTGCLPSGNYAHVFTEEKEKAKPVAESHAAFSALSRKQHGIVTECAAHHLTFGGRCLNCGFTPKA